MNIKSIQRQKLLCLSLLLPQQQHSRKRSTQNGRASHNSSDCYLCWPSFTSWNQTQTSPGPLCPSKTFCQGYASKLRTSFRTCSGSAPAPIPYPSIPPASGPSLRSPKYSKKNQVLAVGGQGLSHALAQMRTMLKVCLFRLPPASKI